MQQSVEEQSVVKQVTPSIGEIWLVTYPEMYYDENQVLSVRIQTRPFLVLDDGRGLVVEDSIDYHGFKLTTQSRNNNYRRKEIKKWRQKGLLRKSYVRIELPLKIEEQQFVRKIAQLEAEELVDMYKELYALLNINALRKISKQDSIEI